MNKLPTCCEFHHKTECGQSDFCPARAAKHEGVMTMPTGCSTKALPDPAKQPLPVIDKPRSNTQPTLKWFAVLVASCALSALCVLHGTRFFN